MYTVSSTLIYAYKLYLQAHVGVILNKKSNDSAINVAIHCLAGMVIVHKLACVKSIISVLLDHY